VWCTGEEDGGVEQTRFRELGIRFEGNSRRELERLARFTTQAGDSRR
jgi:hypothetical protein